MRFSRRPRSLLKRSRIVLDPLPGHSPPYRRDTRFAAVGIGDFRGGTPRGSTSAVYKSQQSAAGDSTLCARQMTQPARSKPCTLSRLTFLISPLRRAGRARKNPRPLAPDRQRLNLLPTQANARALRRQRVRSRLRERLLCTLHELTLAAEQPQPVDAIAGWFDSTAVKLLRIDVVILAQLQEHIAAGGRWWRLLPGSGAPKRNAYPHTWPYCWSISHNIRPVFALPSPPQPLDPDLPTYSEYPYFSRTTTKRQSTRGLRPRRALRQRSKPIHARRHVFCYGCTMNATQPRWDV